MEKWVYTNTIIGPVAEGDNYFPRPGIEEEFWKEIEKGCHILFTAPRRVGKSSVMKYLASKERDGFLCIYQNIESDATANEFYRRLFELTIKRLNTAREVKERLKNLFERLKVEEVSTTGVKIGESEFDYKKGLLELVEELNEQKIKIVLFLDEFPDVIDAIAKGEGADKAREVLHTTRQLRHTDTFRGCFTMILAGSVGLSHIVSKVDKQSIINDLQPIEIDALSQEQAYELIDKLTSTATMVIPDDEKKYLTTKIGYLLPYFIQLVIKACDELLSQKGRKELTNADIDQVYRKVLEENKNFEDWAERLKEYFPNDYDFFMEILCYCAHKDEISISEALNIAIRNDLKFEFKIKIKNVLVADGYLIEKEGKFYFQSPFLKDWWKDRFPKELLEH